MKRPKDGGDISFDRLFTKMVMIQDMMALIVADKTNRGITKVAHGVAQFVFPTRAIREQ